MSFVGLPYEATEIIKCVLHLLPDRGTNYSAPEGACYRACLLAEVDGWASSLTLFPGFASTSPSVYFPTLCQQENNAYTIFLFSSLTTVSNHRCALTNS